jgi:hypothetical protein
MCNRKLLKLIVAMLFAAIGQASYADTFQGSIWSLTFSGSPLPDADPLHETYEITLGVDTTGYTGSGSFLDQVALKVSSSLSGASLVAAPGGIADWMLVPGGIDASGCSGSGGGFECADSVILSNTAVGGVYSWVFDLTMDNSTLFTGLNEASVKGRFVDTSGNKVGDLVSENVTLTSPVPEPEIYAMLSIGLGLMGWVGRRRKLREAA